jgi:hypothetical protein
MKVMFKDVVIVDTSSRRVCVRIDVDPIRHSKRWAVSCKDTGGNLIGGVDVESSRDAGIKWAATLCSDFERRQGRGTVELRVQREPLWSETSS